MQLVGYAGGAAFDFMASVLLFSSRNNCTHVFDERIRRNLLAHSKTMPWLALLGPIGEDVAVSAQ